MIRRGRTLTIRMNIYKLLGWLATNAFRVDSFHFSNSGQLLLSGYRDGHYFELTIYAGQPYEYDLRMPTIPADARYNLLSIMRAAFEPTPVQARMP